MVVDQQGIHLGQRPRRRGERHPIRRWLAHTPEVNGRLNISDVYACHGVLLLVSGEAHHIPQPGCRGRPLPNATTACRMPDETLESLGLKLPVVHCTLLRRGVAPSGMQPLRQIVNTKRKLPVCRGIQDWVFEQDLRFTPIAGGVVVLSTSCLQRLFCIVVRCSDGIHVRSVVVRPVGHCFD